MKKTDYSNIADKYDKNKFRNDIKLDQNLKDSINQADKSKYTVLDLACGTGLYLKNQIQYFQTGNIVWHGIDASEEMLDKARINVKHVILSKGLAEELPYENETFDYIVNNYSFHHFEQKSKVLDEVKRVLKKNGLFKIHNIAIHDMSKWWIYQYFPSAYFEDLKRFWQKELIFNELTQRDFAVQSKMEYKMEETNLSVLIDYVYNRDISALTIISNKEYREGLAKIESIINKDPHSEITNEFAAIFIVARKK